MNKYALAALACFGIVMGYVFLCVALEWRLDSGYARYYHFLIFVGALGWTWRTIAGKKTPAPASSTLPPPLVPHPVTATTATSTGFPHPISNQSPPPTHNPPFLSATLPATNATHADNSPPINDKSPPAPPPPTSCPACNRTNLPDAGYCEGCGAELLRACPECGLHSHVSVAFCRQCGTSATAFNATTQTLEKARKASAERRYDNLTAEINKVLTTVATLRHPKGTAMVQELNSLANHAVAALIQRATSTQTLRDAHARNDSDAFRTAWKQYCKTVPIPDPDLAGLAKNIDKIDYDKRVDQAYMRLRKVLSEKEWYTVSTCLSVLRDCNCHDKHVKSVEQEAVDWLAAYDRSSKRRNLLIVCGVCGIVAVVWAVKSLIMT